MTRLEENSILIDLITKKEESIPTGTYVEKVFQLNVITTLIADISKSLAILADNAESEVQDAGSD